MRTLTIIFAVIGFSFSVLGMDSNLGLDLETFKSTYSKLLVGISGPKIDPQLLLLPPQDFIHNLSEDEMKLLSPLLSPLLSTVLWHRYKAGPRTRFEISFKEIGFTLRDEYFKQILLNIYCLNKKKKRAWPALSMHPEFAAEKSYKFTFSNDGHLGDAEGKIAVQLVLLFNALTSMKLGPASLSGPKLAINGFKASL